MIFYFFVWCCNVLSIGYVSSWHISNAEYSTVRCDRFVVSSFSSETTIGVIVVVLIMYVLSNLAPLATTETLR